MPEPVNPLFGPRKPVQYSDKQVEKFEAKTPEPEIQEEVLSSVPLSNGRRGYSQAQKAAVIKGYPLAKTRQQREALAQSIGLTGPGSLAKLYNLASRLGSGKP